MFLGVPNAKFYSLKPPNFGLKILYICNYLSAMEFERLGQGHLRTREPFLAPLSQTLAARLGSVYKKIKLFNVYTFQS